MGCMKTNVNGVVTRVCSLIPLGNKCEKSGGTAVCVCDSELCNGSDTLAISMTLLLCAMLAVFFSKF
ncbi:hypothetical protein DPMN_134775 [Dreissena polymorpha]|uniref:Uncharacterized protein n=1 Tax=Dreissena polymorpha TaxID=45954 RepID=A0A9D4FW84_DREPO|nr:hypothetical protein DPMN_134775 [Dreissena polymorpha]